MHPLCHKYTIQESSVSKRRQFVRIDESTVSILSKMIPWARKNTPVISRELYDHKFSYEPTRNYFESMAQAKNMSLANLREHLEKTMAQVLLEMFEGSQSFWGLAYLERRLQVGVVHDRINLPFKWYVGAYAEIQLLFEKHLRTELKTADATMNVLRELNKIINYDLQAVGDSFILSTIESAGLSVEKIRVRDNQDVTECLAQVKESMQLLRTLLDNVRSTSADLKKMAAEFTQLSGMISKMSDELARGSQSQASAIEQINASAEEMQASIAHIAQNAQQATQTAQAASVSAEKGKEVVAMSMDSMKKIQDSSDQINQIIAVIGEIASQTNLLALNAAIEAARAGSHGMGFAVVADEVRKLAERSATAAKDIERLIKDSKSQVDSGAKLFSEVDGSMTSIRVQSQENCELINSIRESTEQQKSNSAEVTRAMEDIAKVTQNSAMSAENLLTQTAELARGAQNLSQAAESLSTLISQI